MRGKHEALKNLERLILDRVTRTLAVFGALASVVGLLDWWTRGHPWVLSFTGFVFVVASIASLHAIDDRKRSLLLVGAAFATSLSSFYFFGYMATPAISLMLSVLLGYALIGPRFSVASTIATGIAIVGIGALQSGGFIPLAPGRELFAPEELGGWVRVALLYLTVSLSALAVIRSQHDLLIQSLDEQSETVDRLRAETDALERANAERDRAQKRLRDAERLEAIGQLAGSVAHDMNNTLTVVLGSAELLRKSNLDGSNAALVADLIRATESGSDLCRQLLSCARRSVLSPRNMSPTPFLNDVARLFSRLLPKNVTLDLAIDDDLPMIHVDEAELQHALLNLLGNARDALADTGTVTLRATVRDERVWIAVEDDGIGIPEEIRDRVFEPLFSTKKEEGGTGLGLASVLGTVTQSDGCLELDSMMGRGTTVHMGFPIVDTATELPTEPSDARSERARILIVDDDPAIARLVSRLLRGESFEPTLVEDAERALDLMKDRDFDILLTDVVLPGRQGNELADLVLRERPHMRVVLMSGYMDDDSARAISDRRLPLLPKPFSREDLLAALDGCRKASTP